MQGLFKGFEDQWTPVELASKVKRKPVHALLAGTPVVLFRDGEGRAHALVDRCPHRGVMLSRGRVTDEGLLECPFHGWQFAGDGACRHIPLNDVSGDKLGRYGATGLPTRERSGLVWVYTRPGQEAPDEPYMNEIFDRKSSRRFLVQEWDVHWSRAMENMLDSPHLPWVHKKTIGRIVRKRMKPGTVMKVHVHPTDYGFRTSQDLDGEEMDGSWLDWNRPNGMTLNIPIPGRTFRIHVWCVPIDERRVKMILCTTRDFGVGNPFVGLFDEVNRLIAGEDKRVLEGTEPPAVPHASEEKSVASDRATLYFRTWYFRSLLGRAEAPAGEAASEAPAPVSDPGEATSEAAPAAEVA